MTNQFLFAWSVYIHDNSELGFHPSYFAVSSDYSIYNCDNWEQFYHKTRCYCPNAKQIFCDGYFTANKEIELFEHKQFSLPFYIDGDKLIPVQENEITYYPYEADNEAAYFRNHQQQPYGEVLPSQSFVLLRFRPAILLCTSLPHLPKMVCNQLFRTNNYHSYILINHHH